MDHLLKTLRDLVHRAARKTKRIHQRMIGRWALQMLPKLRHWRLEGSNDGSSWTTLREHSNDTALADVAFSVAHWPLPDVATAYRHFRIYQTGKNSNNQDSLMCAGIELYGVLLSAGAE